MAGFSGFAILKGSPHPELAVKFLEYMTRPDIQVKLASGTGGFIPTVVEANGLLGNTDRDAIIRHAVTVLDKGTLAYIPISPDWASVKQAFDEAFNKIVLEDGSVDADYLKQQQEKIDTRLEGGQ